VVAPVSTRRARGGSPATEPALGAALAAFAAEAAPAAPAAPAVRNPYAPRDPYDDPAPATVGAPAGADAASGRAARLRQERLAHSAALAAGSEPVAAGRRMPDWQRWTLVGVWGAVAATGWWAWSRLRAPATDAPAAVAPAVAGAPVDSAGATDTVARARAADSLARLAAARDSARRDSVRQARTPVTLSALTVANPADSGAAAAYAVYLQSSNTPEGAVLDARTMETLPPAALTPLLERGAPWYRLLVGAYRTRAEADRLLADLRRRDVVGGGSGSIVRAPYALRVAERVAAADVPQRVLALTGKNVPVYPLSNGDGTVSLYAGAFETPEQAAYLARNLQAAGVQPVLVYRTGRSL
jgi:hypothetical protein